MRREIDEAGEHTRRKVDGGERQAADETFEYRAKLNEDEEAQEEMQHAVMHER